MKLRLDKERVERLGRMSRAPSTCAGRVLLVDDEADNLHTLERLLGVRYEVFATTEPTEALGIVERERLDVVITDQRMPGMLGTELLARIKQIDDDNVRMILTGYTDAKDLVTCINDGLISRYLVKPWRAAELEAVIDQGIEQVRMQRTFRQLIPHQILHRLYDGRLQEVRAGEGREIECAVLFLDVHGFSRLSEQLGATSSFRLLNGYLSAVAPAIQRHHGFVDKYLGDGLLAIFDREGSHRRDAVACARELVALSAEYNAAREADGLEPLRVGVGLCAGRVVLGTLGLDDRLEFTVLGDAVNTAHRIQELTGEHGCTVLLDAALLDEGDAAPPTRPLGEVTLRGKDRVVTLHALDGVP